MSKKEDKPGEEGAKKEKGGKSNLVPALVVAVGLIVGGFLMGRGGGGDHPAEAAAAAPPTTEATGGVAKLEAVTMNLADGKYLKVTIGLALKKGADPKEFLGTGEQAKALDLTLQQLSHYTMEWVVQ
jgi:flagellar FliL protein